MRPLRIFAGLLSCIATFQLLAAENPIEQSAEFAGIFKEHAALGTIVVLDLPSGKLIAHDPQRAAKRFIPASTFKIPNTMIGLETGVVKSVDEVLPYGGKPQPISDWEHDMGLREAIRISAVPIYQELARRIGVARMNDWITRLDYGNRTIGTVVDQFWLQGPLEISAIEQANFLARLTGGKLPVRPEMLAAVKEITLLEKRGEYALHGKTGWCTSTKPAIGWWVGWVERSGQPVATFALNIDMPEIGDAPKRLVIGKACLQTVGALPPVSAAK
jgi:beta-lactamase class D